MLKLPASKLKKSGLVLLLATLTILVTIGCGTDDPKPAVTRLYASATCGVAPLRVDFRGDATGGTSLPDPTGGNNWLRMTWDFGDGTVIQDGTSIAFHEYDTTGTFVVTLTAEDDNGDRAQRQETITVQDDSLAIEMYSLLDDQPATEVEACRPLQLGIFAETCGFDPVEDSYERFVFLWTAGSETYSGTNPRHTFEASDVGQQEITVMVEDPTRSITRFDTLYVDVVPSPGADVGLAVDWLKSPQGTGDPILERDVPSWPDTLTYTVHLTNDGPGDAYNLTVVGTLDLNNRVLFYTSDYSAGDFTYQQTEGNSTVKRWTWNVDELATGGEETIDITFYVEVANAGVSRTFTSTLQEYACDPDPSDRVATALVNINTVPPPP